MSYIRVLVLVPIEKEEVLITALKQVDVLSMHVQKVSGYCSTPNFYSQDWAAEINKFELFIGEHDLDSVKKVLKEVCLTGAEDDGVIAVTSLIELEKIKNL